MLSDYDRARTLEILDQLKTSIEASMVMYRFCESYNTEERLRETAAGITTQAMYLEDVANFPRTK